MSSSLVSAGEALQRERASILEGLIAERDRRGLQEVDANLRLSLEHGSVSYEEILTCLTEALLASEPSLLKEYVRWAKVVLAHRSTDTNALKTVLVVLRGVLKEKLPPAAGAAACEVIDKARNTLAEAPEEPPSYLEAAGPLRDLAADYLRSLLRGDRRQAGRLIEAACEQGADVRDIYMRVLEPVQHEVGRLWQLNRLSVAHEHYCSAATQLIMSQLYPRIARVPRNGRTVVVTCVAGELHEIGPRMVADFFEMNGWDAYYLGASVPSSGIVQSVIERLAPVLCISATMSSSIALVREIIQSLRASAAHRTRVLVGGHVLSLAPGLADAVGADATAVDAQSAVEIANRW